MTTDDLQSPDDAALAAEFAMGLLSGEERAAAAARQRSDPAFAEDVRHWTERLANFADEVTPVAPPPQLKVVLEETLFGAPETGGKWLRFWQGLSLASLTTAAALAAFVLFELGTQTPGSDPALFAAEVTAEDDSLRLLAVYQANTAELRLTRTAGAARSGRALELWVIAGDAPPRSLGVLPADTATSITVPVSLRAAVEGGVLAISDEPPGGSTTGAPTGDVLAVGAIARL